MAYEVRRVLRLRQGAPLQHRRQGLPAVLVRPLAAPQRRPARPRCPRRPHGHEDPHPQGDEPGGDRPRLPPRALPRQAVNTTFMHESDQRI